MISRVLTVSIVLILFSALLLGSSPVNPSAFSSAQSASDDPKIPGEEERLKVEVAILAAVAERGYRWGAQDIELKIDNLEIAPDGNWAKAWLVYYDPALDLIIPTEPGVVVAVKGGEQWMVYLPGDAGWEDRLAQAPESLITAAEAVLWQDLQDTAQETPIEALTGYHLPWEKGKTVNLTASVSHDGWITSGNAHYAFDFAIYKTMWPIHAAKSGTVYTFRDDIPDYTETEPNFIVLRNIDDSRYYQVYLHLAQDSIPPELKVVGAPVAQGQYIGTADDTGMSTGHHLHFQVGTTPYWPEDNPYWNVALDMVFDEVAIYGGRPRLTTEIDEEFCYDGPENKCVYGQTSYVSQNTLVGDLVPPYGDLSGITTGDIITASTVTLSGWGADDDSGLDYGQLVVNYAGEWHYIGEPFTDSFEYTWNLCAENAMVPDGAVSVAMRLFDNAGNWEPIAGLRHFTKDFSCPVPPPSCIPAADQVTLFEEDGYAGGCARFNIGEYPEGASLVIVGNNDAESMMLGSLVMASLFSENYYTGHSETLVASDSYLLDNLIGANTLSSMIVSPKTKLPSTPKLVAPVDERVFTDEEVIPLSWRNGEGATQYQVTLTTRLAAPVLEAWQDAPFLLLDPLPPGEYTWKVAARNVAGTSPESSERSFTVEAAPASPAALTAPFAADFETDQDLWKTTGTWTWKAGGGVAGSYAWWYQGTDGDYDNGAANYGTLTSPPIRIPAVGYYLRFKYRYETENSQRWWDQRWIQISVDDGPFTNLYQHSEDPRVPELLETTWLNSPVIDLSPYSGHNIRVRLMLTTFDESLNVFDGWGIDEFNITSTIPAQCSELHPDDDPSTATLMVYDPEIAVSGEICPGGDWDYYHFNGMQGDHIVIDVDANADGSPLDPYLVLYDSDGKAVLAEDDDELLGTIRDPLMGYTLLHDGTYYFKIRAWNHPSVGDTNYDYQVRLFTDEDDPVIDIVYPKSKQFLSDHPFTIQADVDDPTDEINRVEFYWHSVSWLVAPWTTLGTDWEGADGWSMVFDPSGQPEGLDAAIFVLAYDRAGHLSGAVSWDLGIDKTAPYTNLSYIEQVQASNAFPLIWSGSDNLSGIDYVQIQQQLNGGAWVDEPGTVDGDQTQLWIIGGPENEYGYRMRGVDISGNTEEYPLSAEITVTIPGVDVLCNVFDTYDTGTDDNSKDTASSLVAGGGQAHNFCNPLSADRREDEDWVSLVVEKGQHYTVQAMPLVEQTAVRFRLYAVDGETLLKEVTPTEFGRFTQLDWIADRDGMVYLQMSHLNGQVIGSSVAYQLLLRDEYSLYLPKLGK